jgi:hypothetical protein
MVDALDQATLNEVQKKIEALADKGYRVPELPVVGPKTQGLISGLLNGSELKLPKDLSLGKEKRLRRLAARFLSSPTWGNANAYLHFLYKKCLGLPAPRVKVSERVERIHKAREAWKRSAADTEKLRAAYRAEKGDFYKHASAVAQVA